MSEVLQNMFKQWVETISLNSVKSTQIALFIFTMYGYKTYKEKTSGKRPRVYSVTQGKTAGWLFHDTLI